MAKSENGIGSYDKNIKCFLLADRYALKLCRNIFWHTPRNSFFETSFLLTRLLSATGTECVLRSLDGLVFNTVARKKHPCEQIIAIFSKRHSISGIQLRTAKLARTAC